MSELEHTTSVNPDPNAGTPTPTPDPEPEGAVEVPGKGRMVPLSAVIEERRARQSEKAERERLTAENATLTQKAKNYDILEPYIPLIATHPKITGEDKKTAEHAPAQDPELVKIARTFGFYDTNSGELDLDRAESARNFMDQRADGRVSEAVRPIAQTAEEAQAARLRQEAYGYVDKNGQPFAAREAIDQILDQIPLKERAQPAIVKTAVLIARGMSPVAAGEPLHTEGGGHPAGGAKNLSSLERAAARARGMSEDQWAKMRDNDSNILE